MWIGITGKAGSGKDTVGRWFVAKGFTQASFARPLKAALAAMGFPEPANRDDKEMPVAGLTCSWRHLAQTLGTEWRNLVDPDLWIKLAQQNPATKVVWTDVRFDAEAQMIRNRGGFIIHLSGRQAWLGSAAAHSSEAGVEFKEGDVYIPNTGSLPDLYAKVQEVYRGKTS